MTKQIYLNDDAEISMFDLLGEEEQGITYPVDVELPHGVQLYCREERSSVKFTEGMKQARLSDDELVAALPYILRILNARGRGADVGRILASLYGKRTQEEAQKGAGDARPILTLAKLNDDDIAALYLDGVKIHEEDHKVARELLDALAESGALLPAIEQTSVSYFVFLENDGRFPERLEDATKYNVGRYIHRGPHYVTVYQDGEKVATYSNEMIAHIEEILADEKGQQK